MDDKDTRHFSKGAMYTEISLRGFQFCGGREGLWKQMNGAMWARLEPD